MTPFGKLFWGFLIVLFDFTINGFDVIVDLVGYVLIVGGLGMLARRDSNFERARPFGMTLLGLSILDLFTIRSFGDDAGTNVGLFGSPTLAIIYIIVMLAVLLRLVYYICSGIAEMARVIDDELARVAMARWRFFLWTQIVSVVVLVVAFGNPDAVGLAFPVVLVGVVAFVMIAALLRRADKAFYPGV